MMPDSNHNHYIFNYHNFNYNYYNCNYNHNKTCSRLFLGCHAI